MYEILLTAARLAAVVVLTLISGFFVASEYALVTLRRTRIEELVGEGHHSARSLQKTVDDLSRLLAATQLGVTLVSLLLGALAEPTVARALSPLLEMLPPPISRASAQAIAIGIAFLFITALDIIVGELAPKAIGLHYNESVALFAVFPLRVFMTVLGPFISVLEAGGNALARLAGAGEATTHQRPHSSEELKRLVTASTSAGVLDEGEEEMLIRVFEFSQLAVRQVMVPRTEMIAIPSNITYRQFLALTSQERHTRIPVFEGNLDNVVGILYLRDFLHRRERLEGGEFDVRKLMRSPLLVPETMRLDDLLRTMQQQRVQIAIAIDEFGGTAGLVTLEDLLERIFGEVQDEFERPETEIEVLSDGTALIDGLSLIDDVNDRFGLHLDDTDYDTLGGYVFGALARKPTVGDEVTAEDRTLRVVALDGLRIARVQLSPAAEAATGATSQPE
ncbi:MAG TPA: hemolysin family protein [Dehalococcoidia bacterium]|nr:hemolysin family protein [Dehalococcoidia bacterium]